MQETALTTHCCSMWFFKIGSSLMPSLVGSQIMFTDEDAARVATIARVVAPAIHASAGDARSARDTARRTVIIMRRVEGLFDDFAAEAGHHVSRDVRHHAARAHFQISA